jgi:hypothetical protein
MRYLFSLLLLSGCFGNKPDDINITQLYPNLTLSTETIDFEGVIVLYNQDLEFQIINSGLAELEITDMYIDGNEDEMYSIEPSSGEIEPNETLSVLVNFEPDTYRRYDREIIIISNDEEHPEFNIPLLGEGIDGPIPDIEIEPRSIDFGLVSQGLTKTEYFTLTNRGTGALLIDSVVLDGSEAFEVMTNVTGIEYGLEQSSTIVVTYTPSEEGGENATLTFASNDPDEAEQTVILLGNGGGSYSYPVAEFSCPTEVDPPTTIQLNGRNSTDPNGNTPLTYNWELLQQPPGSSTSIDEPTLDHTPLFVDVAGDYEVQLTVQNSVGLNSEPATCEFTAIPDESIHVELSWDTNNSDLDLHMLLEGYDFYSYDGDCCWCNPNPSWGDGGSSDDPNLSLDNRIGYGPEAIHIETPWSPDDTSVGAAYNILVHYFNNNGGGNTTATVRIYLDGELIAEEYRVLSNRDLWDVGYVFWQNGNGQFVVENETPVAAQQFRCE